MAVYACKECGNKVRVTGNVKEVIQTGLAHQNYSFPSHPYCPLQSPANSSKFLVGTELVEADQ